MISYFKVNNKNLLKGDKKLCQHALLERYEFQLSFVVLAVLRGPASGLKYKYKDPNEKLIVDAGVGEELPGEINELHPLLN